MSSKNFTLATRRRQPSLTDRTPWEYRITSCFAWRNWPSPLARLTNELGQEVGTDAYEMAYVQYEFNWKVRYGLLRDVNGLDVLEIGCGHGGITCFIAVAGRGAPWGSIWTPSRWAMRTASPSWWPIVSAPTLYCRWNSWK